MADNDVTNEHEDATDVVLAEEEIEDIAGGNDSTNPQGVQTGR
ncbi:hypothetical protein [Streptomyces cadmiisoli]|nr:hypothetical protein [Streptomyces cadmiisoli]